MCVNDAIVRKYVFFFNDTATTEIYTLSLHDALPICLVVADALLTRFPAATEGEMAPRLNKLVRRETCAIGRAHV